MSAILDLNGAWEMVFDTNNQGLEQRWYANPPEETQDVKIPHTWEDEFGKYPGSIAFYYKKFFVPENVNPKRTLIRFQRSFFYTQIWVNSKLLGENFGGHQSFLFNISKAVKPGEVNEICLRVASEAAGRINGTPILDLPVSLPFLQKPFGGLWGDVEFINGGKGSILNLNVSPNLDEGNIVVEMDMVNPRNYSAKFLFILTEPNGKSSTFTKEIKLEKEDAQYRIQLGVKEPEKWSPKKPNLYKLEVYLDKSYGVAKRFGFRKFDILRSEYYLNDHTFKIQGAVYNLSHPQSGGIQKSEKLLRHDLKNLKNCGFNIIRSGGAPLDEVALEICDELGILVWQEMPMHSMRSSKEGLELSKDIIESIIRKQKTHPSIVAWVLGSENGTLMLENGTKLLRHCGDLDHTRPILSNLNAIYLDNEDEFKCDTGKVMGVTNDRILMYNSHRVNPSMNMSKELSAFFANYFNEDSKSEDVQDITLGGEDFHKYYNHQVSNNNDGRVLVNLSSHTTFPDIKAIYKNYGKSRTADNGKRLNIFVKAFNSFLEGDLSSTLWESPEAFAKDVNPISLKATADKVSTFLSSPLVNGYFIDCWADSNTRLNGFVDEFRNSKGAEEYLKEINSETRLLLTNFSHSCFVNEKLSFQLKYLNGAKLSEAQAQVAFINAKGKVQGEVLSEKIAPISSITALKLNSISVPAKEGDYYLEVSVINNEQTIFSHKEHIMVVKNPKLPNIILAEQTQAAAIKTHKLLFVNKPSVLNSDQITALQVALQSGTTIIVSDIIPEEVDAWNKTELFPESLRLANSTGSKTSAFHYWEKAGFFKGVHTQIADSMFADVSPNYSWINIPGCKSHAECVCFTEDSAIMKYIDVAEVTIGKGKIIFHQFKHLTTPEIDPIAAQLLSNI